MKDKMTLGLVCAFFIGLAYFGSSSIETSNIETKIISEFSPVQLESESLEIINDIPSEKAQEVIHLPKDFPTESRPKYPFVFGSLKFSLRFSFGLSLIHI